MARKRRLEVEGGLYHLITRGVDRRDIFHSPEDHRRFLSMLADLKGKLPFYLYSYCLMTNHIHLLIERMTDDVGRIMHRLLTGYSQYYNRKYRRTGHLFQGRHRAILCQSDAYLAELVRYIHLNPVRAKMVDAVEQYPFSSHLAYLGLVSEGITDVDPLLRRYGPNKILARQRFVEFVAAGAKLGTQEHLYADANGILGTDDFVDETIHRIGDFDRRAAALRRTANSGLTEVDLEALLAAVEQVSGTSHKGFCGTAKGARQVFAKEIFIVTGRQLGSKVTELSAILGLSSASTSRRHDSALSRLPDDPTLSLAIESVLEHYNQTSVERIVISKA
ncbi:transposase [soil metagenome]